MPSTGKRPPARGRGGGRPARGRLRIGPRGSGRPIRPGIRWDRLPGAWLLAILVVMALLYVPPLHSYVEQRRATTAARAQLRQLGIEHKALEKRARALKRSSTIELEARKLGMVKPGERPYVVK